MSKFIRIYGFYLNGNNGISNSSLLYYRDVYSNAKFSLKSLDKLLNTDNINFENLRQYVSFDLFSNINRVDFNHNIFGSLISNNNGIPKFNGNYKDVDDLPYIELHTLEDIIRINIEECLFTDSKTISIQLNETLYNCTKVKFVSYKPFIINKQSQNIITDGVNFSIGSKNITDIDTTNIIDINLLDSFKLKDIQKYPNFLEIKSDKSVSVNDNIFNTIEYTDTSYLYQKLYNSPENINIENFSNIVGGIYLSENDIVRRVLLTKLKAKSYYDNITEAELFDYANQLLVNGDINNLDDYESLKYIYAEPITISKLEIDDTEKKPLKPTPQPTATNTPSISFSPTQTPRVSPTSSPTPLPFDNIYLWKNNISDIKQISDSFRISDIATVYRDINLGDDHSIVEMKVESKRVFSSYGNNEYYQTGVNLSRPKQDINTLAYTINNIFQDPYKVSLGNKFSYVINRQSFAYRWGDNTHGQLSTLEENETIVKFPAKLNDTKYIDVSCGNSHAFLVTDRGFIYFSGLVHERSSRKFIPYFLDNNLNYGWEKVFSQDSLTFAKRFNDNRLYLIGGLNKQDLLQGQYIRVVSDDISNYKKISVGNNHAFILNKDGSLYGYGDNSHSQLGIRRLDNAQNYANYANGAIWENIPDLTPTPTSFYTPTPTPTLSISQSITPSNTTDLVIGNLPDFTSTPTNSLGFGETATPTPTSSASVSINTSPTPTASLSSNTVDITPTPTASIDINENPTSTPTVSNSLEATPTPSVSESSQLVSPTPTSTEIIDPTQTPTPTTSSVALSPTPSTSLSSTPVNTSPQYDYTFAVSNLSSISYNIDGATNPDFTLIRGGSYLFNISSVGHPFFIKTIPLTGTGSQYNNGVTNNGTDNGQLIFEVPLDAPDTLYYICQFHANMVGTISVSDLSSQNTISEKSGSLTSVGTNGRSSYYGTYDQNGNIHEMVLSDDIRYTDFLPIFGGAFNSSVEDITNFTEIRNCNERHADVGFRLCASPDISFFSQTQDADQYVLVESTDNQPVDKNNLGYVPYPYSIAKYPVQNKEYVEFLNYNIEDVEFLELWEDMHSDLQGIYFDDNEYLCKPNMDNKPVNFLLLSNKIRYVNWKFNNYYHRKDHHILNDGSYKIDITLSQFSSFGGATDINNRNKIDTANRLDNFVQKRFNEQDVLFSSFLWICNAHEWYKAAYYNGETQKYNKYATNSDIEPNIITNVDNNGNGDSGGTIYEANEYFVKINDDLFWTDIAAGQDFTLATTDNILYGWGSNRNKTLVNRDDIGTIIEPKPLYKGKWRKIESFNNTNMVIGNNIQDLFTTSFITPTPTTSPTVSITPSITASPTTTPSFTQITEQNKPSVSLTPTPSISLSLSASRTPKPTSSNTPTISLSKTPNVTNTKTPTPTKTNTPSLSIEATPTPTPSITTTAAITPTPSITTDFNENLLQAGCYLYQLNPKTNTLFSTAFFDGDTIPENGSILKNNPLYVGDIAPGDYVDIRAWGTARYGWRCDPYSPDGSIGCPDRADGWGNNPAGPLQGRLGTGPIFRVGSSASLQNNTDTAKSLYLFITDYITGDNTGYFDIAINVSKTRQTTIPCITPNLTPDISPTPTVPPPTPTNTPTKSPTGTNSG